MEKLTKRMTYVPIFYAEGHDRGCAAHDFEPCDCVTGILNTIKLAFAADLKAAGRTALKDQRS